MGTVVVVVMNILLHDIPQLVFREDDKVIQALLTDRAHKAFRKGVHVRGIGDRGEALNIVFPIGEIFEFAGIVVNKVRAGIVILKGGKLPAEKGDGGIGSKVITDNLSGLKLNNEEDIETFETEDVYGKEVAGKEGLPVGGKETFPGTGRLETS
jgi:hypothetical protein